VSETIDLGASTSHIRRITLVLFLAALAAGFAEFGATTSLNDVARHFGHVTSSNTLQSVVGLSGSSLGLGLAAYRLSSLAALPLSSLADRWGRTKVLRRTLITGLLITALAALSPNYWFFVLCFAVARPLLSVANTLIQIITVELASTRLRVQRIAFMAAGLGIGSGLSAVVHGLVRGTDSFRWLFALALVPVLTIVPLLRAVPEPPTRSSDDRRAHLGVVPREAWERLSVVSVGAFVIGVISGPAGGFTFVYSEGILKMRPSSVSLVVVTSGAAGLLGLFASRRFARTLGRRWTVGAGVVATAIASTYAYSGGKTSFIVGYILCVGAGGLLSPAMTALCTEIFAHRFRATAAGWITIAGVLGAIVGLGVFGWIGDAVHTSVMNGLRVPALVTFLPLVPAMSLLARVPESKGMQLE
jgi:AAHS family benzoate transporter-like MFS transporter